MNPRRSALRGQPAHGHAAAEVLAQAQQHARRVLSLNGIPVATAELKNPMTGQTWRHAVTSTSTTATRHDLIFQFKKRTLVHFAVDTDEVYMTTRLGRQDVLPALQQGLTARRRQPREPGRLQDGLPVGAGAGAAELPRHPGALHPPAVEEKKLGGKKVKTETMIFPRYHQLDCVRQAGGRCAGRGAGTTTWCSTRRAAARATPSPGWRTASPACTTNEDEKVFDSVVVVTDRRRARPAVAEHHLPVRAQAGRGQKIDENSAQLAEALAPACRSSSPPAEVPVRDREDRRAAEPPLRGHRGRGPQLAGRRDGAAELKGVLAGSGDREQVKARPREGLPTTRRSSILQGRWPSAAGSRTSASSPSPPRRSTRRWRSSGVPGRRQAEPFHLYSMRQAIEEGFILDVLQHYTTYKTYYRLIKSIEDDPKVEKKKAAPGAGALHEPAPAQHRRRRPR
jgi:type I restriction enzyme, R subunit